MRAILKKIGILFIVICTIIVSSCNETLPLREDVSNLVTTKVRSSYYTTSHSQNAGKIRSLITVTNNTDETLDDISPMTGTLEITWTPPKEEEGTFRTTKTFKLSAENIFYATYNKFTKRLTLDPGDSVVIFVDWNLVTDDGTDLFEHFRWVYDQKCFVYYNTISSLQVNRRISDRQNFLVKANIKLFDRLSILYIQNTKVSQCFMYSHGGEGDINKGFNLPPCTDFTQFDPCSVTGQ